MEPLDAIHITSNAPTTFTRAKGYAFDLEFGRKVPREELLQEQPVYLVAIDAVPMPEDQLHTDLMLRDMNKAFAGFARGCPHAGAWNDSAVATGNWGCGSSSTQRCNNELPLHCAVACDFGNQSVTLFYFRWCRCAFCAAAGAFGGSVWIKSILQWLAASRAQRPMKCGGILSLHVSFACSHTHTRTHTRTHTHARTHSRSHIHTRTHTHTLALTDSHPLLSCLCRYFVFDAGEEFGEQLQVLAARLCDRHAAVGQVFEKVLALAGEMHQEGATRSRRRHKHRGKRKGKRKGKGGKDGTALDCRDLHKLLFQQLLSEW